MIGLRSFTGLLNENLSLEKGNNNGGHSCCNEFNCMYWNRLDLHLWTEDRPLPSESFT